MRIRPRSARFISRHTPNSRYWVDFTDFAFFRLKPVDVYNVGGFGVMGWVTAAEYAVAFPDPLAEAAQGILDHMNADHGDALVLLTRVHAKLEAESATMISVDRLGFHVRVRTSEGMKGARIAFLREVSTPMETRTVLVEMVKEARHG